MGQSPGNGSAIEGMYLVETAADVGKLDVREAAATLPEEDPLGAFAASRDSDPDLETPDDEEDP